MAGGWEARWRFKEWTKKFYPAVDNPTVAVPKPKPKGKEGVKVGIGDEHLGRVRVGEEPVPFLHGHVVGLDVREFRWETTREAGEREQKVGRAGGGRRESPPPRKPKKEVGSRERGGKNTRGEAEKSRERNWERQDGEVGEVGNEESGRRAGECRY